MLSMIVASSLAAFAAPSFPPSARPALVPVALPVPAPSTPATRLWLAGATLPGLCAPCTLAPTMPGSATPPREDTCSKVAAIAMHASHTEAAADFLVQIAARISSGSSFWKAYKDSEEAYFDAIREAGKVFDARLHVCKLVGEAAYDPDLDPKDFSSTVDHPYFPLEPGRTLVYRKKTSEGVEVIRVTTKSETIDIDGIECRIIRDVVKLDGELIEDTFDWYAQDKCGNVWYLGEIAKNYEDGRLHDLDGSWTSGEDLAKPGILMPAKPSVGLAYRQEYYLGVAEDLARVVRTDAKVTTQYGTFENCIETEDWTPLEPGSFERKFYARGIGFVYGKSSSGDVVELVRIRE
ncbi:MAG: hypothetical protein H6832_09730 [Planctomycetes bacterium]|nr:hypothetical protein [Planctomycetota bacterium]